tara:strand:- start:5536 stop:6651 length:1116 start_codon:yes stop_codon:yes gene_type:complete
MKVLFVCGSLEPGKDGVGDYIRLLSFTLIKRGIAVKVIALNDKYISDCKKYIQTIEKIDIPSLRVSSKIIAKEKNAKILEFIDDFNPSIVSIQYVPYAFNSKGLPFNLTKELKHIIRDRKVHFMFHELWIGMEKGASLKNVFVGKLQRKIVSNLLKKLNPVLIHTHTEFYKYQLTFLTKNVSIEKLHLFGNIPVVEKGEHKDSSNNLNLVLFGSIHYQNSLDDFLKWILDFAYKNDQKVFFHFIGNNGAELEAWVQLLKKNNVSYKVHGRKSVEYISKLFLKSQIGITTTPYFLVEKSGSVAAMLEHDLPVLCVARDWLPNVENFDVILPKINVIRFRKDLHYDLSQISNSKDFSLERIGDKFINSLNKHL